jgi:predicted transcriptional regulator
VIFLVRTRRDDLEVCMEILEHLISLIEPISITELSLNVRIKHQKAKQLLDSMEKVDWITSTTSMREDLRFKDLYEILPEGSKVLKLYYDNLENLFKQLQIQD